MKVFILEGGFFHEGVVTLSVHKTESSAKEAKEASKAEVKKAKVIPYDFYNISEFEVRA